MAIVPKSDAADGSMAMAMGDDAVEGYGSFVTLNSTQPRQGGDGRSLEDENWVDYLIIKDAESSENRTSLMDAPMEAFSSRPHAPASSTTEANGLSPRIDVNVSSGSPEKTVRTFYELAPNLTDEELEKESKKYIIEGASDFFWSRDENQDGRFPAFNEDESEFDKLFADFEFNFPASGMEPTAKDIFKVWDLDIYTEEDELSKQLKSLSVDAPKVAPVFVDSGVSKVTTEDSVRDLIDGILNLSVDDLISGISDMSLNEESG